MKRLLFLTILCLAAVFGAAAFTYNDGRGSLSPYPGGVPTVVAPDSLTPIFINHVGRHGSRYPAGPAFTLQLKGALDKADSLKTITPLGRKLLSAVNRVAAVSKGRWGALDTIGMAEQHGIAARMAARYPQLMDSARVSAVSSLSPRCVMSMYAFMHRLSESGKHISLSASSGDAYTPLLRPFDVDESYKAYRADTAWVGRYRRFLAANVSIEPLLRVLGSGYPLDYASAYDLALSEYYVLAGADAMGMAIDAKEYFTLKEWQGMWSTFNFRQYLLYSSSTVSQRPAAMAAPLLQDLVATADSALSGKIADRVRLRFGHAETLMPLTALMGIPGCRYLTNYFDTVADNWRDYASFPMAANLQMVFFRAPSGTIYVRVDFNEHPVRLLRNVNSDYVRWDDLRLYLLEQLPLE